MTRRLALLVTLVALGGASCLAIDEAPAEAADPGTEDPAGKLDGNGNLDGWTTFATGIAHRSTDAGDGVFIAYGGYGATSVHVQAWTEALRAARLDELGLGHLYAVKGPRDAGYNARELPNSKVTARLLEEHAAAGRIVVVAHSSGAYVAHELLAQLRNRDAAVLGRVSYFNLDGGDGGLPADTIAALATMRFVYARHPAVGLSRNGWLMQADGERFAPQGAAAIAIDGSESGCATRNCLHDVVITSRPHDPSRFNVALDYTDFDDRPVTVAYLPDPP
jgi:pimeloyl-ACP methyl ester carboxylesterase